MDSGQCIVVVVRHNSAGYMRGWHIIRIIDITYISVDLGDCSDEIGLHSIILGVVN